MQLNFKHIPSGEASSPIQMGLSRQRADLRAPHWPILHIHRCKPAYKPCRVDHALGFLSRRRQASAANLLARMLLECLIYCPSISVYGCIRVSPLSVLARSGRQTKANIGLRSSWLGKGPEETIHRGSSCLKKIKIKISLGIGQTIVKQCGGIYFP
jgi:hypothetical protein